MNEMLFNKMIIAAACGVAEKEKSDETYLYSNKLIHSMNIFAASAYKYANTEVLSRMHEQFYIENYLTKPVAEWFEGWDEKFVKTVSNYDLYNTAALIELSGNRTFYTTYECDDLINDKNGDIFGDLEQGFVYKKMTQLSDNEYTLIRSFIIEHPVCSTKDLRSFKIQYPNRSDIAQILELAYQSMPIDVYKCPTCGWTMTFHGKQAYCCNHACVKGVITPDSLERFGESISYRLKRGIMRYFAIPGKIELKIKNIAETLGAKTELWPDKDKYDIKIVFPSGLIWAINAKTNRNPYTLAKAISNDISFSGVQANKRYYVIPDELCENNKVYCEICNEKTQCDRDTECITFNQLKRMLKEKIQNG
ncbi:MAG: hypothetical protein NC247_09565 [Ruminococcus flavefaciens]|nr:hypothetical protein [Ruminococcus flavefaciens]